MSTSHPRRAWRMRSHLAALLVVTMLLAVVVMGAAVFIVRLPAIERNTQDALHGQVERMVTRVELLLGTAQSRLELMASLVEGQAPAAADALLDDGLRSGMDFDAAYLLSADGRVVATGLAGPWQAHRAALVGRDLSTNALFLAAQQQVGVVWDGRYRSPLSGARAVGLALRDAQGQVLVAEVSSGALLRTVKAAAGRGAAWLRVVDRDGELIVDTDGVRAQTGSDPPARPVAQAPLVHPGGSFGGAPRDGPWHAAMAHSSVLGWHFIGHAARGWANPHVQRLVAYMGALFLGCLAIGLVVAPFSSRRLTRPLLRTVERVAQTMRGESGDDGWPQGTVAEFNQLSRDLQTMAHALQEREQKFLAIFNASPVPMTVADAADSQRLLDVNDAWCRELRRERSQVLGRTAVEIGLLSQAQRQVLLAGMQNHRVGGETVLLRGDGEPLQARVFARRLALPTQDLLLWAVVDIGPLRRVEQQLRELNQQLGERVAQRTEALAASNATLSATLEQLRSAQDDLVRTEKMAALGSLVAGVAHELNTPLGNGVMAVSAMADAVQRFRAAVPGGLKRADLLQALDSVEQGTDIAQRNLRRAADLVQSFKQVAVDRASAQRRSFELGEVVHEMVVSLRPSLARTPYRVEVEVPETGLRLDSYPGALGQVIGNLIDNAVLHGFDGRGHGTVRIRADREEAPAGAGWVCLRVSDDGRGIAAEHIGQVFEPFMTTRAGRGGTGLGLHISHNAVTTLLGGTLSVQSTLGEGTCFTLRLPVRAPMAAAGPGPHAPAAPIRRSTM